MFLLPRQPLLDPRVFYSKTLCTGESLNDFRLDFERSELFLVPEVLEFPSWLRTELGFSSYLRKLVPAGPHLYMQTHFHQMKPGYRLNHKEFMLLATLLVKHVKQEVYVRMHQGAQTNTLQGSAIISVGGMNKLLDSGPVCVDISIVFKARHYRHEHPYFT